MTGRPRCFEESEVLERAMDLFWKKGYEATGLRDLVEVMEIGRQSLYSTFGDKKQLFLRALSSYLETTLTEIRQKFEAAPTPIAGLRGWLDLKVVGLCSSADETRGCFALNSIVEMCPGHSDVVTVMQKHFERLGGLITEKVSEGQAAGEIRTDKQASALAHFLLMGAGGLIVSSKLEMAPELGQGSVEFLLECVEVQA